MARSVTSGKPISPKQVVQQWRHLPHKFQLNLWNFEIKVGREAVSIFRDSFNMKRFNSSGSEPWTPRSSKSRETHPLMVQSHSLVNSIKWKHMGQKGSPEGVTIFTDPNGFGGAFRHSGFCYAAVHNSPDSLHMRTGSVANMPQRQFMGHSTVLDSKLKELSGIIFQGFPK